MTTDEAAAPPRRVSHAQNGEDVRAWRALRDVEQVFYVEVGASDPVVDSLTVALSAEGATGVLFEADPAAAELLRQARPRDVVVAAAATSSPGVLVFHDLDRRGWGSVAPERVSEAQDHVVRSLTVPAVRVDDVLRDLAPEAVHFMSVDVEGHEAEVLAGAGLAVHRPWVLCVEATQPNSRIPAWHRWEPEVLAAGYRFVAFDGLNRWYVAEEHEELAERVAEPFGVLDRLLDGWVPAEVAVLEDRIARRDADVAMVEATLAAERQRADSLEEQLGAATAEAAACREAARAAAEAAQDTEQRLRRHAQEVDDRRRRAEQALSALRADRAEQDARWLAEVAAAHAQNAHLVASRSWRYTAPMREALHAVATGRPRQLPARARTSAVRAANRALVRHPELRASLLDRLSSVPGLTDRLRTWHVPTAELTIVEGPPVTLHATADARLRTGIEALIARYDSGAAAAQAD
jgi:FkbM family methyltransferase